MISSKFSRKPRITIRPPTLRKPLFINLDQEDDDDVKTPPPTGKPHTPSPPNAPLKTPYTRGTSSLSSIPSTHEYHYFTLTYKSYYAFDSASPPLSPIMGYPTQLSLVDLHGANCLCCLHTHNIILSLRDELHFIFSYIDTTFRTTPSTIKLNI
ncbi:hypothetical protein Tco_0626215 [Tanacetum coccineum]|uniref:Uncharacterized protein n=1 Tax=Tanacetum coccineum TaxID=301880 RepID=A0ABQ4WJ68_9ASTR